MRKGRTYVTRSCHSKLSSLPLTSINVVGCHDRTPAAKAAGNQAGELGLRDEREVLVQVGRNIHTLDQHVAFRKPLCSLRTPGVPAASPVPGKPDTCLHRLSWAPLSSVCPEGYNCPSSTNSENAQHLFSHVCFQ